MTYSRKYSRNFVPLKQDSDKYNLDFRPSLGRCLIEIKDGVGRLNVYAQGIKPKNSYNIELISCQNENFKNISAGSLNIDSYGKGDFSTEFNPDNVFETGKKIEDFNILSVISNTDNEPISSLVGYMGNEVEWKGKYLKNLSIKKGNVEENNPNDMPSVFQPQNPKSEFEQGLIEKEQGLIEREEGLIEKEKGLIEKEKAYESGGIPITELEEALKEKEEGLREKEKGLIEKEEGLREKEIALDKGYLPTDAEELRAKERELIEKEQDLIKREQSLIQKEKEILNSQKPTNSDLERALKERERGLIEKEQGLIEKEKGLIERENGLLEKEKGIREREEYLKGSSPKTNSIKDNNHEAFKVMIEKLKRNVIEIENISKGVGEEVSATVSKNSDIDYIKFKNAPMTPFKEIDRNISWHRISPFELTAIGRGMWKYSNNPFIVACFKKYKHLMLGINRESEKESYILAVPCRYDKDFLAKGDLQGFDKFSPVSSVSTASLKDGEYGYRILYVQD